MEKVRITDSISETLFINIPMKAGEHTRPDGILKDPFFRAARQDAGL